MKWYKNNQGFGVLIVLLIVAAVAAIGTGGYYAVKSSNQAEVKTTDTAKTGTDSTSDTELNVESKTSIKNLLSLGKDVKCTFARSDANGDTSGTIYISGGDIRGDFSSRAKGRGKVDSQMIRKGDKTYMWSSSAQGGQGIMMTVDAATIEQQRQTNPAIPASFNVDEALDYKCSDWSPEASKFTPPSEIKFMDISAMIKANADATADANANIQVPLP